jgi:hypothetical protein
LTKDIYKWKFYGGSSILCADKYEVESDPTKKHIADNRRKEKNRKAIKCDAEREKERYE